MRIVKGRKHARPIRALIHGVPGVGKTHIAAGAPSPLLLDAEYGSLEFDADRVPVEKWADAVEALRFLRNDHHDYRSLVIDTLDALERTLAKNITGSDHQTNLDKVGGGYGKGWARAVEAWKLMQDQLDGLQAERGINVIVLAHSTPGTFSDPDGDSYNRWTLRVNKKTHACWEGWVDEILFLTRHVSADKHTRRGQGGQRILHCEWAPGRLAKSRRGLPARLVIPDCSPQDAWGVISRAARAAMVAPPAQPQPKGEQPKGEQPPCPHRQVEWSPDRTACTCRECGEVLVEHKPEAAVVVADAPNDWDEDDERQAAEPAQTLPAKPAGWA